MSPYLGSDGIRPFLECCEEYKRMIFLLVKTSNPSSGELQDKVTDGKKVYELMAEATTAYGESYRSQYGYSNCGAVVGATYPCLLYTSRCPAWSPVCRRTSRPRRSGKKHPL